MRYVIATVAALAAALGGCQMLDSTHLEADPAFAGASCRSNAGTYHLPRRLLTITMSGNQKDGYGIKVDQDAVYVADRSETYCLDFLLSATSADRIGVQRDENGLLQRIFTQADDKTPAVAAQVIQAAADLVASNRASLQRSSQQFKDADNQIIAVASYQFDPFVEREAREVNEALATFGFCVYLDPHNDPFVPSWSEDICRGRAEPRAKQAREAIPGAVYKAEPAFPRSGLAIFDPKPVPPEMQARGILYRPELSHSLVIIRKQDRGSRSWRVAASERVVMPNAAPAFILEVKRATFVKAETDIQFTSGMIKSISINKPSELLAASDLAVTAAQTVVNIPARTLTIFNNRADNTEKLIQTNAQLINVLRSQNADADAAAQAQQGTNLILSRSANTSARTLNVESETPSAKLTACLNDPATQQYPDPVRVCQEIVNRGL
jgi:hypothetical protein